MHVKILIYHANEKSRFQPVQAQLQNYEERKYLLFKLLIL